MKTSIAIATVLFAFAGFAAAAGPAAPLQGEVLEIRDVEVYTYLRLRTAGGEVWAAVSKAPVSKGARVTIDNPMVMHNFESKSLKKTFDKIVFGSLASPSAPAAAAAGVKPPASMVPGGSAGAAAAAPAQAPAVKVAKATGADARTVAEVVGARTALKDKGVSLRGKVVKVNLGIMGKNWFHLQDGSGAASAGTNDILVTSKDQAALGEVITVKGTVRTDVQVGAGYNYSVLIEGAAISR